MLFLREIKKKQKREKKTKEPPTEKPTKSAKVMKDCFPNIIYFVLVSGDLQDQLLSGKLAS